MKRNGQTEAAAARRARPAYPFQEAARYLFLPLSTLRSWFLGQEGFEPVIEFSDRRDRLLSFDNLVEAHVLAAMRRKHSVSLQHVRRALNYTKRKLGVDRPLIRQEFVTNGIDLFVEKLDETLNVSQDGQLAMQFRARLERIDRDKHGLPIKLFPYTRSKEPQDVRLIVIDPEIAFGRPAIVGRGISTQVIGERFDAGEPIDSIAQDYGADRASIEEAIRCELRRVA
ncbi:MAG: DUF433 domain-containing protein [Burkholderiaceae bacterium]|nr:DUF433 domain-containing protein [Burkholderiaceae bacterium]